MFQFSFKFFQTKNCEFYESQFASVFLQFRRCSLSWLCRAIIKLKYNQENSQPFRTKITRNGRRNYEPRTGSIGKKPSNINVASSSVAVAEKLLAKATATAGKHKAPQKTHTFLLLPFSSEGEFRFSYSVFFFHLYISLFTYKYVQNKIARRYFLFLLSNF